MSGQLKKYVQFKGVLHCDSGLRIGGSKEGMEIGGSDSPIIRHPIKGLPYVPGSSLKGKIRSLLELKYTGDNRNCGNNVRSDGKPCGCGQCLVCTIFGSHNTRTTNDISRVIFRDAQLTEQSLDVLEKARAESGVFYSEEKTEIMMNRKTGAAYGGGLRTMERVPEGTEFALEISLRVFDGDDEKKHLDFIKEGLSLLQKDTLGGSGSRGYGKVSIRELKIEDQAV